MIFRIKEKFWSWGNDFSIDDAVGNLCYDVDGKAFSWGNKLSFQDPHRSEIAFISQKLLSWKPRYQIIIDDAVSRPCHRRCTSSRIYTITRDNILHCASPGSNRLGIS